MCKRTKNNRRYTYESMCKRIKEANSFDELDFVMELAEKLLDEHLLTDYQYSQLQAKRNLRAMDMFVEDKA